MRALLVVNPAATTTTPRTREVILARARRRPRRRGRRHRAPRARTRARAAGPRDGLDAVLTLGGDGTVNEVVNGLLRDGPGDDVPVLGAVPGGSANVFVRALGLPADPVEATGALLEAMARSAPATIGLGTAEFGSEHRWFAFNCGIGIDAEIIASMERQRSHGATATPGRYLATTIAQFFTRTDRATPRAHRAAPRRGGGRRRLLRVRPEHRALDVPRPGPARPLPPCLLRHRDRHVRGPSMAVLPSLRHVRRMVLRSGTASRSGLLALHDQAELTLEASRPMPLQLDGDFCGSIRKVRLTSDPAALRVLV